MICPNCSHNRTIKNGIRKDGIQQYKCNDCKKSFCETTGTIAYRKRFPLRIIKSGIILVQFNSTRVTSFIIDQLTKIKVSHQSIYNWAISFTKLMDKLPRFMPNNFTNVWHVDEKFVRVADNSKDKKQDIKFSYLWVISDSNSNIIAVLVSHKRDSASARKALSLAKLNAGFNPEILVSDSYCVYPASVKKIFGRKTKHIQAHFETKGFMHKGKLYYLSNNKAESINSKINLWYKRFRGFKTLRTANLWCSSFMNFYNYIRPSIRIRSIKQVSFQEAMLLA